MELSLGKGLDGGIPFMWLFTAIAALLYAPLFIGVIIYVDFTFTYTNALYIAGSIIPHLYFYCYLKGIKLAIFPSFVPFRGD